MITLLDLKEVLNTPNYFGFTDSYIDVSFHLELDDIHDTLLQQILVTNIDNEYITVDMHRFIMSYDVTLKNYLEEIDEAYAYKYMLDINEPLHADYMYEFMHNGVEDFLDYLTKFLVNCQLN